MNRVLYNGIYYDKEDAALPSARTTGVFETMLVREGKVVRPDMHLERAEVGLNILQVKHELKLLFNNVIQLFISDNKITFSRIRLQLFPAFKIHPWGALNYLLSAAEITEHIYAPEPIPCKVAIYGGHLKPLSAVQNAKLNERTIYQLAQQFTAQAGADDALVLNEAGRPIESTISNLWWRKGETWFTPPLSEGPVAGTIRALLLEGSPFEMQEAAATVEKLFYADEIMLTNAIRGVRPVESLQGNEYDVQQAYRIADWLRLQ
jgi:branched-chain amino acid aminotransferase